MITVTYIKKKDELYNRFLNRIDFFSHACMHVLVTNFRKNSLSCVRKKNLYSIVEYYKTSSKKGLTMSKLKILVLI